MSLSTQEAAAATSPKPSVTMKNPDFGNLRELVKFLIGPTKTEFFIHKQFPCTYSPVLNAALNGAFIEGRTQIYSMEDTTKEAFALFSQWLYTQRLEGDFGGKNEAVPTLCRLWILAEKLLIPRLQNLAIDLIDKLQVQYNMIWTSVFHHVWENTAAGSPLRRLFIHCCVWHIDKDAFRCYYEQFPKEALSEICTLFRENAINRTCYSSNMAEFYVKED